MKRPRPGLVEQQQREETIRHGANALLGCGAFDVPPVGPFPEDALKGFGAKNITSRTVFDLGVVSAHSYISLGHADASIALVVREALAVFESQLFDHIEKETKPFVSKLRPRGKRR